MNFKPYNRHLLLQERETKEEPEAKPTILVPDDYKVKSSPYGIYEVLKVSDDCTKLSDSVVGLDVVVNESMVESVSVGETSVLLILENHVYGAIEVG